MPQLANIVVKDADDTTDVTFVAVQPAAGTEPARWEVVSDDTIPARRMTASVSARNNKGPRRNSARVIEGFVEAPCYEEVEGAAPVLLGTIPIRVSATVPRTIPAAAAESAVARATRFFASPLGRAMIASGFAAS